MFDNRGAEKDHFLSFLEGGKEKQILLKGYAFSV